MITIIEHQSKVYHDMAFKLLRYIVMVLTDYEKEMETQKKGCTKRKDFKYPPVLPIVYYEGTTDWTAARCFKDRVAFGDTLDRFIPNFEYIVVPLRKYTKEEIMEKNDALSLIMLINQMRDSNDFKKLKDIPTEYLDNLEQNTPEYLLKQIAKIVAVFLYRLNIPKKEVEVFTDQIERREFNMMFDSFEAYDVQETRKISREEGKAEGQAEFIIDLLEDLGDAPESLRNQIMSVKDTAVLKHWHKLAAKSTDLNVFMQQINDSTSALYLRK